MNDYGYHLAAAISEHLMSTEYAGVYSLSEEIRPAIEYLEYELWRDLMRPGSLWSNIRLVHQGRDLHPSKYMMGRIGDGLIVHSQINDTQLGAYLADGATLIYNHLHETSRIVQRMQESLEYQLGARVWVQAYLTKTNETAFGLHVDDHNFVVLQVAGRKDWFLQFDTAATKPGLIEQTLFCGDFAAVPANTPHKVSGCGDISLHLTIAFDWLDPNRTGSIIPAANISDHTAARRIGSTVPLSLCSEKKAGRLRFRFRDRIRPTVLTDERGTQIDCQSGSFFVDFRFAAIVDSLAEGRELTKADLRTIVPGLSDDDMEKFLRFGIDNEILSCSG